MNKIIKIEITPEGNPLNPSEIMAWFTENKKTYGLKITKGMLDMPLRELIEKSSKPETQLLRWIKYQRRMRKGIRDIEEYEPLDWGIDAVMTANDVIKELIQTIRKQKQEHDLLIGAICSKKDVK